MKHKLLISILSLYFVFAVAATNSAAFAATLTVTKTADTADGACSGADCSLREAIRAATATAADDTITFSIPASDAGCSNRVCTITLTLGELVLGNANGNGSYTITNAAGAQSVRVSGNNQSRVFYVESGEIVTINNLTVTGGRVSSTSGDLGGGIINTGILTIINSIISGNTVNSVESADGGGIFSIYGSLTITGSTISGNSVSGNDGLSRGGGIYVLESALTITDSTISNNSAVGDGFNQSDGNFGGGIYLEVNLNSTATIERTTISGNFVSGNLIVNRGGGIFALEPGITRIINCTVSGNFATGGTTFNFSENYGGGLFRAPGNRLEIINSTIFGNSTSNGTINRGGGIYSEGGGTMNLTNDIVSGNNAASGANVDGPFSSSSSVIGTDAILAPLGFYGGSNYTHTLLSGSPALNTASSGAGTPRVDQRGVVRDPVRDNLDVGAVEQVNSFLAILPTGTSGRGYSFTVVPEIGSTTFCVASGSLPPGVTGISDCFPSLKEQEEKTAAPESPNEAFIITGTPTASGIYDFVIRAARGGNTNLTNYRLQILAPTAAAASISGRVMVGGNRGLANALVYLTDQNGETQTVRTGSFGYYRFDEIAAGQTVVVRVVSKAINLFRKSYI